MIKLKLASMSDDNNIEIKITDGELLSAAIEAIANERGITEGLSEIFNVVVNGNLIEPEYWPFTALKETDNVLIAPKIKNAKNVGQILLIVAIAVTAAYTGGATAAGGMSFFEAGLINAGVAVVGSYLISQLIPPPILDNGVGGSNIRESQTYSITSQSNTVRKFGTVPKVYGKHRMFPIVAANPYTELEADPNTGVYSQYFYAIYDFGLGPVQIEDLKIGNTRIANFDQVKYNLVDPNKPAVNEGAWDIATRKDFIIYKGDVSSEAVSTTINKNSTVPGDPIDQYQAIRSAAINPNLLVQEITMNLVCPRGLYAFDSVGNIGYRTIETFIEYQKVTDVNNWKPFNDPATVSKWSMVGGGGSQAYSDVQMKFIPAGTFDPYGQSRYGITYVSDEQSTFFEMVNTVFGLQVTQIYTSYINMGYPVGTLQVIMSGEANVGENIKIGDNVFGKVQTKVFYGAVSGINYYTYTFVSPTTFRVDVQGSKKTRIYQYGGIFFTPQNTIGYEFNFFDQNQGKKEIIVPGKFQIRANTQEAHFATIKFTPNAPGEYQVRITRLSTSSSATTNVQDELTWVNINTRSDTNPIKTDKRHTFLEIKIKASGQLNGALQNLSAVCTSVLDTWNGTAWVKAPTDNPAWIYADILTGEAAKKPISKSRLHIPSLVEWANYANAIPTGLPPFTYHQKRFTCNFILDFETTVQNLLQQITGMAQCTPNIIDGKYGVLLDVNRTTPVQIFTPRNSWGFSSSKAYAPSPHAVKVSYIDPARDWQPNEVTVYDDAYNSTTATEFQDLNSFGVTNYEQALRYGRFFASQHKFRQETFSIKVDFENLVCTRGDFVQITQDVMKVGGTPARVKTITGSQIIIDDKISIGPGSYGYTYRKTDGTIHTNTLTIVSSDTFILSGTPLPAPGELIIIGPVGSIVFDCIVKSIVPEQDFSATIYLVEKGTDLYGYENVLTIQSYDPKIKPIAGYEDVAPPKVTNLVVTNNYHVITDSTIRYFIDIDWEMPVGSTFEAFEVYVDSGKGYDLQTVIKPSNYTYEVNTANLGIEHKFKVLAVSSTGKKLLLGEADEVTATPVKYSLPPPDVTGFTCDISGETIQFYWDLIKGHSITNYMIRYSPFSDGTWEQSTVVNNIAANTNLYSTQARLGKYFIKAFNSNSKESDNAAFVVTTVPVLPNMNLIATINDFPLLEGSVDKVVKGIEILYLDQAVFGTLGNEQFHAEGYYYFKNGLSLPDIFTVRLTAKIVAQGVTLEDLLINWETLDDIEALATANSTDWDVELQYRTVENFIPISDWTTLSSVASIGAGNGTFTQYRKFLVGDATGKNFQFRMKITSLNPSVTPRVTYAVVTAEMANRDEKFASLSAPDTGLTVTYANAFYGPGTTPNVQPSILNGQSGDYWVFSSQTLSDFTIVFYDKLNNPVARQFSAVASGYGRKANSVI